MMNTRLRITRRHFVGGLGALAALATISPTLRAAGAVKVGWTNDTEQSILGNITALILEKKLNIPVERVGNLGGTGIAHQAIIDGAIDIYPDYTGDALANVLKQEVIADPVKCWEAVRDGYASQYAITWLKPTPFNNTYALALKEGRAAEQKISTISDLAPHAAGWNLGCSVEFAGPPLDGYPGMAKHYGFEFGKVTPMEKTIKRSTISSASKERQIALNFQGIAASNISGPKAYVLWEMDVTNGRDIESLSAATKEREVATLPGAEFSIVAATVVRQDSIVVKCKQRK